MRIGDLRKKLDEWEAKWTAEDERYMGLYADQEILVPAFQWNKPEQYDPAGAFDFKGYTRDVNLYWDVTGLGLIMEDYPSHPSRQLPASERT